MPRSSIGIGRAENEETVSTMRATSGYFANDVADLCERIHDAGRGFVVDQGDGVEIAGSEFLVEGRRVDRPAPLDLKRFGVLSATAADVEPFVGEGAAHAVENPTRNEIADGCFHHAPGGRSGKEDWLLRSEQSLQPRMN